MKLSKYFVKKLRKAGISEYVISKLKEKLKPLPKLRTKTLKKIINKVIEEYNRSLISPKENIGIVTAQSVGEPGTQMTLRTFHFVGVKELNVTLGLPRLIEIFDARSKPSTPSMEIPLIKEYSRNKEKAYKVAFKIEESFIDDCAEIGIEYGEKQIVITPNKQLLKNYDMTIKDLVNIISQMRNIKVKFDSKTGKIIVVPSKNVNYQQLHKLKSRIEKLRVKGIPGISRAVLRKVKVGEDDYEYIIVTEGSNLKEILKMKEVDKRRVYTNDIFEIYRILGIEAARNAIIREASKVLEDQGLDVNIKHIMLIADVMTRTGRILQIGRHGIVGEKQSVLAKSAFEITTKHLYDAAAKGLEDNLVGASENIIVGQQIPTGTGSVKLLFDFKKYIKMNKENVVK